MSKLLDYTGLQHYHEKVQEEISQLGLETRLLYGRFPFSFASLNLLYSADASFNVIVLNVSPGDTVKVTPGNDTWFIYTILKDIPDFTQTSNIDLTNYVVEGGRRVATITDYEVTIPSDGRAMVIQGMAGGNDRSPKTIQINGIDAYASTYAQLLGFGNQLNGQEFSSNLDFSSQGLKAVALPHPLKAGHQYSLTISKSTDATVSVSTSTTNSFSGLVDADIAVLQSSTMDFSTDFIPTGPASYILVYDATNATSVSFSIIYKGINSEIKRLTNEVNDLEEIVGKLSDGSGDWSDETSLKISEPRCAVVNFSGISAMPTTKTDDAQGWMQFWDMAGNYFKKRVIMNAQGRSTMSHPKKNVAIDICNDEWVGDDTFKLQIGAWVPQDSFHLKAFYNDPFRGLAPVGYKWYNMIVQDRGVLQDYVWKRALLDLDSITSSNNGASTASETKEQFTTGATCFPDGFPCIVYLNGDFYGIYSWQLKKHRDNYHMNKSKAEHVHLDGSVSWSTILGANGDSSLIVWTTDSPEGIEVRNPKGLILMDGTKYDADNNGGELIDSTSAAYDAENPAHVLTAQVKTYILDLSKVITIIGQAATVYNNSSKTPSDLATFKSVFETYFDPANLIDYYIFSDIMRNFDGFGKNAQWVTYDGVKWYICIYDVDCIMGNWWELNQTILPPLTSHISNISQFGYLLSYYNTELEARYKELRDKKIIDAHLIVGMVNDWLVRIGQQKMFKKEWEKWPDYIKNDSILRLAKWVEESIANMDLIYHYE